MQFTIKEDGIEHYYTDVHIEDPHIRMGNEMAGRDICIVHFKENGRDYSQAFYRSTGHNSNLPGIWFPFDGQAVRETDQYFDMWIVKPKPIKDFKEIKFIMNEDHVEVERWVSRLYLSISCLLGGWSEKLKESLLRHIHGWPVVQSNLVDIKTVRFVYDYDIKDSKNTELINRIVGRSVTLNYPHDENLITFDFNELYDGILFNPMKYLPVARRFYDDSNPIDLVFPGEEGSKFVFVFILHDANIRKKKTSLLYVKNLKDVVHKLGNRLLSGLVSRSTYIEPKSCKV